MRSEVPVHPARLSPRAVPSLRHSVLVRYAIPFITVIGAVLITRALQTISPHVPGSLLFCAAIFSGWFGGIGPGLLAAIISSTAILFNLIPAPYPVNSIAAEIPRLAIYSTAVFFVAWISGQQRQAEKLLQQVRNGLEEKVQERTAELRHTNDELQAEIADRKSAEEALQTMQAELAHVSRVSTMGELTASIAHEVNQPLGAIMNYANACRRLLMANPDEKVSVDQALLKIVEDAHRASDVIARIRALAKKKPTEKTPTVIRDLIADVVAVANYEMRARGVTIVVNTAAELPRLQVDRVQIQQVLLNLIINGAEAMESTPPPDRTIEISVRSALSENEPALILSIRDHGTGVKPDDESRLFTPFHSTKPQGLGLGLTISRSIIEAHSGRLTLLPSEGAGATFQIQLPVKEEAGG